MKTSLGIWAFGPMVTRFVPGGYQPEHSYDSEPVAEKVHRAVEGLGDLMDGYEFHYPTELSPDNLDEVKAALGPNGQKIEKLYIPEKTKKTEMLEGSPAEVAKKLVEKLKNEVRVI